MCSSTGRPSLVLAWVSLFQYSHMAVLMLTAPSVLSPTYMVHTSELHTSTGSSDGSVDTGLGLHARMRACGTNKH